MPALWPLGWSGASRDVQKAQSLKDLVSLILHQLLNFNPMLLKSNLQPKPMEYIDFSDFFWQTLKWVLSIRARSGPMGPCALLVAVSRTWCLCASQGQGRILASLGCHAMYSSPLSAAAQPIWCDGNCHAGPNTTPGQVRSCFGDVFQPLWRWMFLCLSSSSQGKMTISLSMQWLHSKQRGPVCTWGSAADQTLFC